MMRSTGSRKVADWKTVSFEILLGGLVRVAYVAFDSYTHLFAAEILLDAP